MLNDKRHVNEWASNRKWLQSNPRKTYQPHEYFLVQTYFFHFTRNGDMSASALSISYAATYVYVYILWWHKSCNSGSEWKTTTYSHTQHSYEMIS